MSLPTLCAVCRHRPVPPDRSVCEVCFPAVAAPPGGPPDPATPGPAYRVLTWDAEEQRFTPQLGVDPGPHTLFGLRAALRELRDLGYPAARGDPFVLVERIDR